MFKYETVDILAKLYSYYFNQDPRYSSRSINDNFGRFISDLGFRSEVIKNAYYCDSTYKIRDFIFNIYNDKLVYDEPLTAQTRFEYLKILAGKIKFLLEEKYESKVGLFEKDLKLFLSRLGSDGYYLFNNKILDNEELLEKHKAFFDTDTNSIIRLREISQTTGEKFPSAESLILEIPLYKVFELNNAQQLYTIYTLCNTTNSIDTYCIECDKQTTFGLISEPIKAITNNPSNLVLNIRFRCSRDASHTSEYIFKIFNNSICKIGQYPSVADLQTDGTDNYRKVLSKERLQDFKRSIGLAAHGVGVGSYVYLRRIFEDLVDDAHQEALKNSDWVTENEEEYNKNGTRVIEKILLLKDFLPEYLVKNRNIYGILSKGIHSLSEQECLEYYPVIKSGIELILDEKLEKKRKAEKLAVTQKAIQKILENKSDSLNSN